MVDDAANVGLHRTGRFRVDAAQVAAEIVARQERRQRAFAEAQRHSGRVRRMRRFIPLLVMGAAGLTGAYFMLSSFRIPGTTLAIGALELSGSRVTMQAPHLTGFKKDSRGYDVTASAAAQDLKRPNEVELTAPVAKIELADNGWAKLSAASGLFDSKTETFQARADVRVQTHDGLDARLDNASVDFKAGTVETNAPVDVKSPQGTIVANGMRMVDNGQKIVFEGRVTTVLYNNSDPVEAQAKAATLAPAPAPQMPEGLR